MKVSKTSAHLANVQLAQALPADSQPETALPLDFTSVYDRHFDDVLRWLRALGGPEADLEDLAQEVFVVVRRKLPRFDGGNLPGWLYKIAKLTVRDQASRAWFRRIFRGRRAVEFDELPTRSHDPEALLVEREQQRLFHRLASRLSAPKRETFLLYEIEGYSGEEIARLLNVPVNTVWTRLHHARKDFLTQVRAHMHESERAG